MTQVSCNIADLILSLSPVSLIQAPWPTYHVLNVPKSYFFKAFAFCSEYSFSREPWLQISTINGHLISEYFPDYVYKIPMFPNPSHPYPVLFLPTSDILCIHLYFVYFFTLEWNLYEDITSFVYCCFPSAQNRIGAWYRISPE